MFGGQTFDLERAALNIQQIEELQPAENPAKSSDSRFSA